MPAFHVIPGVAIRDILRSCQGTVVDLVRSTYLSHKQGFTVNPRSYFLRFPDRPDNRIIALPGHVAGKDPVSGLKWISSYPGNVLTNRPRASGVLILNDADTGLPLACLEAAQISAARTAASAALAAEILATGAGRSLSSVAFIGAGPIARTVCDYLATSALGLKECTVYDNVIAYAQALAGYARREHGWAANTAGSLAEAVDQVNLVVLATTASKPHITRLDVFARRQIVLHLSLRDIAPEVMVECANVVDDVDHCLTAHTSPHLTEQRYGTRDFIGATLADVISGRPIAAADRTIIFSPFGLGVLDIAVGLHVYRAALANGSAVAVPDFFGDLTRWQATS